MLPCSFSSIPSFQISERNFIRFSASTFPPGTEDQNFTASFLPSHTYSPLFQTSANGPWHSSKRILSTLRSFSVKIQSSFDIIQDIHHCIQQLPINITFRWVEGHQQEKGKKLDWWGRQNEQADLHAKKFLKQNLANWEYINPRLWYEKWAVYVHKVKLCLITNKVFYPDLRQNDIFDYWHKHHDIKILSCKDID